jgi:hypothetical protein
VAERYFDAARKGEVDQILELYAPSFFDRTPQLVWRKRLEGLWETSGLLSDATVERRYAERSCSGTRVVIVYDCEYGDTDVRETLVIEVKEGEGFWIVGHSVQVVTEKESRGLWS